MSQRRIPFGILTAIVLFVTPQEPSRSGDRFTDLVTRASRVLLTRSIKSRRVYVEDPHG